MRIDTLTAMSTCLSSLDTGALSHLVATAPTRVGGFGGRTAHLEVNGVPVFVKLIPVTDREMEESNHLSTANLFHLPVYYQYGIGSVGFGAWRELASHLLASGWVASGRHDQFPLLYHWRVLPAKEKVAVPKEAYDYLDHGAAITADAAAIRRRLDAIQASRFHVAVFLEHFPHTLAEWLVERLSISSSAATGALDLTCRQSTAAFTFMRSQKFVHFDAHMDNILTDGSRLYFGDFGLASHSGFALETEEEAFLADHSCYDAARFNTSLVHVLCRLVPGSGNWREKLLRIEAHAPSSLAPAVIAALHEHAPTAVYMADLARTLVETDRRTRFSPPSSWSAEAE